MSHRASDDGVRDDAREQREEVVPVDRARLKAAIEKIKERDAELLKRLAR